MMHIPALAGAPLSSRTLPLMKHLDPAVVVFLLLSLAAAAPGRAAAQEPLLIPRLSGPIVLDGFGDEPAWAEVEPLPMVMHTPTFGGAPSERTEVRVAHDGQYLYVAGRMYDSDPSGIRATSLRRDDASLTNDWFSISLDTFGDRENSILFGVTPAGVRTDGTYNDPRGSIGFDWNTYWDAAVRRTEEGWIAEIRIPFSSLRFQERDGRVEMGMSVWRSIARKNEVSVYPAIPPRWGLFSIMKPSQLQPVVLEGVRGRRPVYATPYLLGGAGFTHALDAGRTGYDRRDQGVRDAGVDLKYGITNNLTLDLSYNTDFAQVEADDQQVNLTRFSLFFPEKRQFFQERASVFEFNTGGNDRLFYSRRIGLVGGRPVPLHGGGRLVGRVGGWEVGALHMRTDDFEQLPGERFSVVRLRRQVLDPSTYVGAIVTHRGGGTENTAYGLDALVRLFGQDFLTLNWAQTFTDGEAEVDGFDDRSLMRARWERRGVDGLRYTFDASRVGAVFNPAMGYIVRGDYTRLGDRIAYGWRQGRESRLLRTRLSLVGSMFLRNADGTTESSVVGPEWYVATKSGRSLTLGAATQYEDLRRTFRIADGVTVPVGSHRFQTAALSYSPSSASLLRAGASLEGGGFYDGWRVAAGVTPTWNASRHLELGGSYQVNRVEFPERDQALTAHVARLRTRLMLSTRLTGAAFVQYNSAADAVSMNFRVRYNPREGNDLYIVYNEGLNTDRFGFDPVRPFTHTRTLLVKYSHTLDLGF
jgi:hypothetical protein